MGDEAGSGIGDRGDACAEPGPAVGLAPRVSRRTRREAGWRRRGRIGAGRSGAGSKEPEEAEEFVYRLCPSGVRLYSRVFSFSMSWWYVCSVRDVYT